MKITVTVQYRREEKQVTFDHKVMVSEALKQLGYSTETHLVLRGGELLTEDTRLADGDTIKLIAVISGGDH